MPTTAPYGSWASPITPELMVAGAAWLGEVLLDGDATYWSELRPDEGGRVQLVRQVDGADPVDLLPDGFSARTRVHEYGGGAWGVADGVVFFANWADQRLYRLDVEPAATVAAAGPEATVGSGPRPLTPEPEVPSGLRYADGRLTPDGQWVVCVRERHPSAAARGDGAS